MRPLSRTKGPHSDVCNRKEEAKMLKAQEERNVREDPGSVETAWAIGQSDLEWEIWSRDPAAFVT